MFPDSETAKTFACGQTKVTTIVKEAQRYHFLGKTTRNMSKNTYSLMIDEANDKTDKSSIILIWIFDSELGHVCTQFPDTLIFNIGTAQNLFEALKCSLEKKG